MAANRCPNPNCEYFNRALPNNAKVCPWCETPLGNVVAAPRLPLLKLIHFSGREFQWSGEAGFIGRRSQSISIPPEIDLTGIPNEGIVSRCHARVSWDWSQNSYMIVDMSKNGIYLNGTPLSPGVSYRLMNGDSLQFGQENLVRFAVHVG